MMISFMSLPIASAVLAFVALSAAAPVPADEPSSPTARTSGEEIVPNSRIIILTPGADSESKFKTFLQESIKKLSDDLGLPLGTAAATDEASGLTRVLGKEFSSDKLSFVTGIFDDEFVAMAKERPEVQDVLPNRIHHVFDEQRDPPSYGLPRISSRQDGKSTYLYPSSGGEGVSVYVLDTGIRISHGDFGGRAEFGLNAVDGARSSADDNGHGTHVAATIAGKKYGVAKKAKVIAVKVCSAKGACTTQDIVEGIMWTINDAKTKPKGKVVVNMSLGGNADPAIDLAVQNALDEGLVLAVAAGNDGRDACTTSPGRVSGVVTVAAVDSYDRQAKYSNFGSCVDLYAPGSHIKSAWFTGDSDEHVLSGTSMSAPHVAGVMALFAATGTFTNVELSDMVVNKGTHGEVERLGANSPDVLLFNNADVPVAGSTQAPSQGEHHAEEQRTAPSEDVKKHANDEQSSSGGESGSEDGYDEEDEYTEEEENDEDAEDYESEDESSSEDSAHSEEFEDEAGSSGESDHDEDDGECDGDDCGDSE